MIDHLLVMRVPLAPQVPASLPPTQEPTPCAWLGCERDAVEGDLCLSHADMAQDLIAEARERWARYDERYGS